ncbi:MAG: hypothetical protein QY316_04495 [Thermodesulfobacteriota bacterium]|nr:MAG: hypothetical protein QY316_04495 [Thermodesulfobacteriota bacterium]
MASREREVAYGVWGQRGKEIARVLQEGASRVLLREPEACMECNRVFVSLYPIRSCREHEGLDEI